MITREEFGKIVDANPPLNAKSAAIKLSFMVEGLFSERDEALKLKEAYRELVLDYESLDEYGVSKSLSPRQIKFIDAEARRIMDGK